MAFTTPPPVASAPTAGKGLALGLDGKIPPKLLISKATGAFSAYLSADQTIPSDSAFHKVAFDSEEFDISGWFDNSTANKGRYTPLAAGVYAFTTTVSVQDPTSGHGWVVRLYKNGSDYRHLLQVGSTGINTLMGSVSLMEANGTTDYFELFMLQTSGGNLSCFGGLTDTLLQGFYVGTLT